MEPRRLTHTIRRIERICRGCWEVQTQTEDGHRFTAFGVTCQQAVYRAHHKAQAYGRYARIQRCPEPHREGQHLP